MLRVGYAALAATYLLAVAGGPWWALATAATIAAIAGARAGKTRPDEPLEPDDAGWGDYRKNRLYWYH